LIGPFGHLENLSGETLESVIVLGLVFSLGVKNAYAIQETFKFTRPRPILLMVLWQFHRIDRTVIFPLLIVTLG
jgi:hypothetical protein